MKFQKIMTVLAAGGVLCACGSGNSTAADTENKQSLKPEENTFNQKDNNPQELIGYRVFSSEENAFSFLYDENYTAYISASGGAEIMTDPNEELIGLSVTAAEDAGIPENSQLIEEKSFNISQEYMNAIVETPEYVSTSVEDHLLEGIEYVYSTETGESVRASWFVERRDDHCIFYETEAYLEESGPEYQALEMAVSTMQLDPSYYGENNAEKRASSSFVSDEPSQNTIVFHGDFIFDVDDNMLVISDDDATVVYVKGYMNSSYFTCEEVDLDATISDTVVERVQEVEDSLQERMVSRPELKMLEKAGRKLTGIEYSYSSADGQKTIHACEYYEQVEDDIYLWYAVYDKEDAELLTNAMTKAIETIRFID